MSAEEVIPRKKYCDTTVLKMSVKGRLRRFFEGVVEIDVDTVEDEITLPMGRNVEELATKSEKVRVVVVSATLAAEIKGPTSGKL